MEKPMFKGTAIYNAYHPRGFINGGYVEPRRNMSRRQKTHDSILSILQPGEIVIPVKYHNVSLAKQVKRYLIKKSIKLPNF